MLCPACQKIFFKPRMLAYGSVQPWEQTPHTFQLAREAGCHLCHLIDASRGYESPTFDDFPNNMNFAFKPLNPDWARDGEGMKWYAFQSTMTEDETAEVAEILRGVELDPTPNGLGSLLATDAPNLPEEAAKSWVVLQFYGRENIILPIELLDPDDQLEALAQKNLESQTSTGSPETLELAKTWLHDCLDNHSSCGARQPSGEPFVPTRLLEVGTAEAPQLRLVSGASLDPASPYFALSHRWGADQSRILRLSNVEAYRTAIPASDVSPTVFDAVHATRALGVRYLWVDCMCIIQDDGGADWAQESGTMFRVYNRSACTIAAAVTTGSSPSGLFPTSAPGERPGYESLPPFSFGLCLNGPRKELPQLPTLSPEPKPNRNQAQAGPEAGLFHLRSPLRVRPCIVPSPFSLSLSPFTFKIHPPYLNRLHDTHVRSSEWFKRGWVFQERMLAPRLLVFSSTQLLWGCPTLQAAESWPAGKTGENVIDRFTSVAVETKRLEALLDWKTGVRRSHAGWWEFLGDYMASELTVRSDRLPAIRGIAEMVSRVTGVGYCGGFWVDAEDVVRALLWEVGRHHNPGEHRKGERKVEIVVKVGARPAEYRAPSFSWACVDGEVKFDTGTTRIECNMVTVLGGVQLQRTDGAEHSMGRNIREVLRIRGQLLPAAVLTDDEPASSLRPIVTRECGKVQAEIYRKEMEFAQSVLGQAQAVITASRNSIKGTLCQFAERISQSERALAALTLGLQLLAFAAFGLFIVLIITAPKPGAIFAAIVVAAVSVGTALYFSRKFVNRWWPMYVYPYFFSGRIHQEELARAQQQAVHEQDLLRKQRAAEEKAQRVFDGLQKGVMFEEPVTKEVSDGNEEDAALNGTFLRSDFRLPTRQKIEIFILPMLLSREGRVRGLVVRLVERTSNQYKRLGTFDTSINEITKLPPKKADEEFLLL